MHGEIFQIKHWNINKRVVRTYFLKNVVIRTPIQGLHCLPRYKDKDFKPRTQSGKNGFDTDHGLLSVGPDLGPNYLQLLTADKSRLDN